MAKDISKRLSSLNQRRRGYDGMTMDNMPELLAKSTIAESYEKRTSKPFIKYALGAMQEVDADYTRIGIEDATRVGKQLENGLALYGISVHFRLQGSVLLNIHIRGVSDVDLLTLHTDFITVDLYGRKNQLQMYSSYAGSVTGKLKELRQRSETVLSTSYPKAEVDKSGAKAIKISGGSLRRSIDVVPSHWHDTADYQITGVEHDRGVKIYNKQKDDTLLNMPFRHIRLVHDRDNMSLGGLKKTIRLCKNVKSDAFEEGTEIALTSFDIAGIMYHADVTKLWTQPQHELKLVAETQRHLDTLCRNMHSAMQLKVPDGSRTILDTPEKAVGLLRLSQEMDELARQVAEEVLIGVPQNLSIDQIDKSLEEAYIPVL